MELKIYQNFKYGKFEKVILEAQNMEFGVFEDGEFNGYVRFFIKFGFRLFWNINLKSQNKKCRTLMASSH